MAPSSCIEISLAEGRQLLGIARQSIEAGLVSGEALSLDTANLQGALAAPLDVFVTLTQRGALRGCMGALQSSNPLAQNAAVCAFNAAFKDPRFSQLKTSEAVHTRIEISVLSEMEPIVSSDRNNLLQQLQPMVDGLLMEDRGYRSIFLPKVWQKLGSAEEFLDHLLTKAGLPCDHWTSTIRFSRFHTTSFAED